MIKTIPIKIKQTVQNCCGPLQILKSDMHGTLFSGARGETTDIVGSALLVSYVVLTWRAWLAKWRSGFNHWFNNVPIGATFWCESNHKQWTKGDTWRIKRQQRFFNFLQKSTGKLCPGSCINDFQRFWNSCHSCPFQQIYRKKQKTKKTTQKTNNQLHVNRNCFAAAITVLVTFSNGNNARQG